MKNKSDSTVGYLYCIYNKMYDVYGTNIYKLGNMKNKNRMNSYVTPYIDPIEIKFISNKILDKSIGEKILFNILKEFRFRPNREFFQCDLSIIKKAFDEVESILLKEPLDKLQELYNPMCKEQIINNMISIIDDVYDSETPDSETPNSETLNSSTPDLSDSETPNSSTPDGYCIMDDDVECDDLCNNNQILYDKFKHNNEQLKKKLKIQLTPEIISKWYNKEYILDHALYALGKKHYDETHISLKIQYLNKILDVFGFKGLLDQDTVVESDNKPNSVLYNKMIDSELLNKSNYSVMMKLFNKSERAEKLNNKFEVKKFIKLCNCVLNEFGFKIDSNRTFIKIKRITIWIYNYKLYQNMIDILHIISKY